MIELAHVQILGAALFCIGMYGVLARRSAVLILMSIELMLNAVNINLVGYAAFADFADPESARPLGQVIVIFVITIAAAELALAMAIILRLYRNRSSVNVDEIELMKW